MSAEVEGGERIAANLVAAERQTIEAASKAIATHAAALLSKAQESCPVQTGKLKASAYATTAEVRDGQVVAEVGYQVDYAPEIHEAPEGDSPKWLERATTQAAATIQEQLAAAIRAALKGS